MDKNFQKVFSILKTRILKNVKVEQWKIILSEKLFSYLANLKLDMIEEIWARANPG